MLRKDLKKHLSDLGIKVKNNRIAKKDISALVKKVKAAGEMTQTDLEKGGEFYEDRMYLENICKQAGVQCKVLPFDVYQGPYALLKNGGKLWFGGKVGSLYYEGKGGQKKESDEDGMIEYLKQFAGPKMAYKNPGEPKPSDKKPNLTLIKSVLKEILATSNLGKKSKNLKK